MKPGFNRSEITKVVQRAAKMLGWVGLILLMTIASVELAVRIEPISKHLPEPSFGSGSRHLDYKLLLLEDMVKQEGAPDCIFLGGSALYRAIDPEIFNQVFREKMNRSINSFNFGLKGLHLEGIASIASILSEDHRPSLLVIGFYPGELGISHNNKSTQDIIKTPWIQHRLGTFNLDGWLIDRFMSYRYYLGYLRTRKESDSLSEDRIQKHLDGLTRYGFSPQDADIQRKQPNSKLWSYKPPGSAVWDLANFKINDNCIQSLDTILRLKSKLTVVMLEMPVHRSMINFFTNGQADYDLSMRAVADHSNRQGVPLWLTLTDVAADDSCWLNINHLNLKGSRIFSRWLADRMAKAIREGEIRDPSRPSP